MSLSTPLFKTHIWHTTSVIAYGDYFAHMLDHLGISPVNPLIQDLVRYRLLVFHSRAIYIYIDDLNHV